MIYEPEDFSNLNVNEVYALYNSYARKSDIPHEETIEFINKSRTINWDKLFEENGFRIIQEHTYLTAIINFATIRNLVPQSTLKEAIDKDVEFYKKSLEMDGLDDFVTSYMANTKVLCYNDYYIRKTVPVLKDYFEKKLADENNSNYSLVQALDGFYHLLDNSSFSKKEKEDILKPLYDNCKIVDIKQNMANKYTAIFKNVDKTLGNKKFEEKKIEALRETFTEKLMKKISKFREVINQNIKEEKELKEQELKLIKRPTPFK